MRGFEQFRLKRRRAYNGLFSARALCIAGLLMMPALVFNPDPVSRLAQFGFFWFLAWLGGTKNNPLITLLIFAGVTAFNLIVPYGRVLYTIGAFNITSGALAAGLQRAATLEGLVMLSRFSVKKDLRIPGRFGDLVAESFRKFALLLDRKGKIRVKTLAADIDALMLELSDEAASAGTVSGARPQLPAELAAAQDEVSASRTKPAGLCLLAAAVILSWLPWLGTELKKYAMLFP
jgi:heptaprenyl diphosphate synthase